MALLELRTITKKYGSFVANDRISLAVEAGKIHALVGENGAGKTTLMTMIAGTATPDGGDILVDGQVVHITSPQRAARLGIGMVHQHFKLVPSLTVAANVFLGRELVTRAGRLDTAAMEARVRELSQRFGLALTPTDIVENLSVGERQRVEVLKALSHDTRLLILDEPTAGVDIELRLELWHYVQKINAEGTTILLTTHYLEEADQLCGRIAFIADGQIAAQGTSEDLSERYGVANLEDAYLALVGRRELSRSHVEGGVTA